MWILLAFLAGAGFIAAIERGFLDGAAVAFSLFALALLTSILLSMRSTAQSISVDATGITATTFLRRKTSLRWSELSTLEEFHVSGFGATRRVRLASGIDGRQIVLADGMHRFDELLADIRRNAPDVTEARALRWWERLWLTG